MARSGVNRLRLAATGSLRAAGNVAKLGAQVIGKMVTRPFTGDDIKSILKK